MSSRLTTDQYGETIVVVTAGEHAGRCYRVLPEHMIGFEERGRAPSLEEMLGTRAPYQAVQWVKRKAPEDELEAIAKVA